MRYPTFIVSVFPCYADVTIGRHVRSGVLEKETSPLYVVPCVMVVLFLSLTYSFVGAVRICKGLELFQSDTLASLFLTHWLSEGRLLLDGKYVVDRMPPAVLKVIPNWAMGFSYLLTSVMELLAPLCIVSRPFKYFFIVFALAFHALNIMWTGVTFLENMLLIPLLCDQRVVRWGEQLSSWLSRDSVGSWKKGRTKVCAARKSYFDPRTR